MSKTGKAASVPRLSLVSANACAGPFWTPEDDDEAPQRKTYRIVHVDDDKIDHMILRRYLSGFTQARFEFLFIDNYEEAFLRLQSERFDVGLIDYKLNGYSGLDLVSALGGRLGPTPLVVMTGRGDHRIDIEATNAGAFDYLDKDTLSPALLERTIRNACVQFETERRLRQNEMLLHHAKRSAEEANKAKSEFLARVSHDLRTPLNAILGFSEIVKDQLLGPVNNPKYLDYAGDIHRSGKALQSMVDDLLDLSKIESGTFDLREDEIAIEEVVATALKLVKPSADLAGLTLRADVAPNLPELHADRLMVDRMLLNLLSNSIKFTPKGGEIRLNAEADDRCLYLIVEDDGIGIATGEIDRIVQPFSQGGNAENNPSGVGLGLAIVRALVDLHGGTFEFDSALKLGARAVLAFPSARLGSKSR